ncbi:MAG: transcription termination factor NusA [Candidatus Taylorbacteria bacterium RIFCSPHIGHO2_01_FULL_51_15]|uniref:Transcription termination/antitermination protein NusA n=1 Tax=Candidatus Taylorbacteria bacterium RIFCSPHIGHO2_01_FULL_51_15 TaxID=1802304 RepID=A0A1G2MDZ8_9BACT|nr:MAG: transcription termination factor NusA [Candidatus Taylorbacteria bacterium RIFCSPHIGHO2_01_FULL_51_15]
MFDLKIINSVLDQLEEERGIPRDKVLEAIEAALATAYKKEYGKKGQIVRAKFDIGSGATTFNQVKIVVDETRVIPETEIEKMKETEKERDPSDERIYFNPEHHIMIHDAKKIKKDAALDEEIVFPLESKGDYGRIAAQTAKQVIIQKIREAEKTSVMTEYGARQGEIVSGTVQRIERGNLFIDMGRATGLLPYEEQIPGERYRQGERVRAYLYRVEESPKGIFLKLSRSHPKFIYELFKQEAPEVASSAVEIKAIAREPGSRTKIAVASNDPHIDPVGSLVGQRGVRVSTVMSELGGEKIDIIEWSPEAAKFIEAALSPAEVLSVKVDETGKKAVVEVAETEQSLAIGKGGQNVRLAAKLTGWKIDIRSAKSEAAVKTEVPEAEPTTDISQPTTEETPGEKKE